MVQATAPEANKAVVKPVQSDLLADEKSGQEPLQAVKAQLNPVADAMNLKAGNSVSKFTSDAARGGDERTLLKSLKTTASSNTAGAMAGLKPWNKDWVFGGQDQQAESENPLNQIPLSVLLGMKPKAAQAEGAQPVISKESQGLQAQSLMQATQAQAAGELIPFQANGERSTNATRGHATEVADLNDLQGVAEFEVVKSNPVPKKPVASHATLSGSAFMDTLMGVQGAQKGQALTQPSAAPIVAGQAMAQSDIRADLQESSASNKLLKKVDKKVLAEDLTVGSKLGTAVLGTTNSQQSSDLSGPAMAPEVTGMVTKGAMAKNRLSTDSLGGVSAQIRNISANGGGEMRIRLKPDNLGELRLRVVSDGHQVGLQIHASDESAKQIIQESMNHLKESLAGHRLNLSSFDVSVGMPPVGLANNDAAQNSFNDSSRQQQAFANLNQQSPEQNGQYSGREAWSGQDLDSLGSSSASRTRSAPGMMADGSTGMLKRPTPQLGRIDLRA